MLTQGGYQRGRVVQGRVKRDAELPPVNRQLRKLRKVMNWSQREIASALGISKRTYEQWEQGARVAAPEYLTTALRTAERVLNVTSAEVKKIGGRHGSKSAKK